MTEQRRLAAILVADVVGYSKLIGGDEAGTLAQLEALRTSIILDGWPHSPACATHRICPCTECDDHRDLIRCVP